VRTPPSSTTPSRGDWVRLPIAIGISSVPRHGVTSDCLPGYRRPRTGPALRRLVMARGISPKASGTPRVAAGGRPRRRRCAAHEKKHRTASLPVRSIASNTGTSSPGEELMTQYLSVGSAVPKASRVSVISRRVLHRDDRLRPRMSAATNALCLSVNVPHFLAMRGHIAEQRRILPQRTIKSVRVPPPSTAARPTVTNCWKFSHSGIWTRGSPSVAGPLNATGAPGRCWAAGQFLERLGIP